VTAQRKCSICGTDLTSDAARCPACELKKTAVDIRMPGRVRVEGKPARVITDGIDPVTGDRRISVGFPGSQSDSHQFSDGTFAVSVQGAEGIGKQGEPWVAKTLCAKLECEGRHAVRCQRHPGERHADDHHRGVDELIEVDGKKYDIQITIALLNEGFVAEARRGRAAQEGDIRWAAECLHAVIKEKATKIAKRDRRKLTLAIDAHFAPILADESVVTEYLTRFGDPRKKLEFASVWVVGPTAKTCIRIGTGEP